MRSWESDWGRGGEQVAILSRMARLLVGKVMADKRSERSEEVNHVDSRRSNIPGRGSRQPQLGISLVTF
jgi:hypothetical protein